MAFVPHLFIGIGATNALFTLRETYQHESFYDGRMNISVRSFHHFNLSQSAEEAMAKAQACAEKMGLELTTSLDSLQTEMRDIKRASADEMQRRERAQQEREALWEAERAAENEARMAKLNEGFFVYGPYRDQEYKDAPRSYLTWLMDVAIGFEAGTIVQLTAEAVTRLVPHLALPKPHKTLHIGSVKQRIQMDVTVVASRHFFKEGFNAWAGPEVCYVTTMVTNDGACVVVFSGAFSPDEGQQLQIKATVKEHSEYNGQAQTIVQRVAVLKEII